MDMKKFKFDSVEASMSPKDLEISMYSDKTVGIYVDGRYKRIRPSERDWQAWRRFIYRINEIEGRLVRSRKV